jgi:hypothetical protein
MSLAELKRNVSSVFNEFKLAWTNAIELEKNSCKKEERKFKMENVYTEVMRVEANISHKMDVFFLDYEERLNKNSKKKGMF